MKKGRINIAQFAMRILLLESINNTAVKRRFRHGELVSYYQMHDYYAIDDGAHTYLLERDEIEELSPLEQLALAVDDA